MLLFSIKDDVFDFIIFFFVSYGFKEWIVKYWLVNFKVYVYLFLFL